jgi:transposase
MKKIYLVDLSESEREQILSIVKKGKSSARIICRANILLLAAKNLRDQDIASSLHTSCSTVQRCRQRFVEQGLDHALYEKYRSGPRPKLTGKSKAKLIALACSEAPSGRGVWTMQLLADRMIELGFVESISDETVRVLLKKTTVNHGKDDNGV